VVNGGKKGLMEKISDMG